MLQMLGTTGITLDLANVKVLTPYSPSALLAISCWLNLCYNYTYNFIQAIGGYSYEAGESWRAEGGDLSGAIKNITAASNSNADLHVFLCKDPEFYGMYH